MALVKRSPVFRVPPFQTLATSLSTDLPAGFKGPLLSSKGMVGRGGEKERGREREGENIEFHHLLLSINCLYVVMYLNN